MGKHKEKIKNYLLLTQNCYNISVKVDLYPLARFLRWRHEAPMKHYAWSGECNEEGIARLTTDPEPE